MNLAANVRWSQGQGKILLFKCKEDLNMCENWQKEFDLMERHGR